MIESQTSRPRKARAVALFAAAFFLMAGAPRAEEPPPTLAAKLIAKADDPDMRVRFQAALALGELRGPEKIEALAKIALRDGEDRWMRAAILSSAGEDAIDLFRRLAAETEAGGNPVAPDFTNELCGVLGREGRAESIADVLARAARRGGDPAFWRAAMDGLSDGLSSARGRRLEIAAAAESLAILVEDRDEGLRGDARRIASAVLPEASELRRMEAGRALEIARDPAQPEAARAAAIQTLGAGSYEASGPALLALLSPNEPEAVHVAAISALDGYAAPEAAAGVMEALGSLGPQGRERALDFLLARRDRAESLLAAVEAGDFSPSRVGKAHASRLADYPDAALAARAKAVFNRAGAEEDAGKLERFRPALELKGDAKAGLEIFKVRCSQCHKLGDVGYALGPDLRSIQSNSPETILTSFLYPSRTIVSGYANYVIETKDGRVATGIMAAAGASAVVLRRAAGEEESIPRGEIASMRDSALSIMPEGLEDGLSEQDIANLIAFVLGEK